VHLLFTRAEHSEEFRAIGKLAFYAETLPALVTIFERGNARQVRAAFQGLRGLVQGIAYTGYVSHDYDRDFARRELLPVLARPGNLVHIRAALGCLPAPSQAMFAPVVAELERG